MSVSVFSIHTIFYFIIDDAYCALFLVDVLNIINIFCSNIHLKYKRPIPNTWFAEKVVHSKNMKTVIDVFIHMQPLDSEVES